MTATIEVRVRRVYRDREPDDGVRVLVDRVWPRGLSKQRADLDEWCKTVAPSTTLRTWYGHDPERFEEFRRRYRTELDGPEPSVGAAGATTQIGPGRGGATARPKWRSALLGNMSQLARRILGSWPSLARSQCRIRIARLGHSTGSPST